MKLSKRERYLIAKLGEEAAELAAACAKLLAKPTTNRVNRMESEFADVLGVGMLVIPTSTRTESASAARMHREHKRAPKA